MADVVSPERRSAIMASITGRNTQPEKTVRSLLHRLGYRFRLHRNDLPGRPDITLPKFHTVIFVHGCFWHGHKECSKGQRLPSKNAEFWEKKIEKNKERDKRNKGDLELSGWKVITIWECELDHLEALTNRLLEAFENGR